MTGQTTLKQTLEFFGGKGSAPHDGHGLFIYTGPAQRRSQGPSSPHALPRGSTDRRIAGCSVLRILPLSKSSSVSQEQQEGSCSGLNGRAGCLGETWVNHHATLQAKTSLIGPSSSVGTDEIRFEVRPSRCPASGPTGIGSSIPRSRAHGGGAIVSDNMAGLVWLQTLFQPFRLCSMPLS
jgi:hypothetical protein